MNKTGVLFSGGKDSCLALHKAIESGKKIDFLLTVIPEQADSWMFHSPDIKLLRRQACELGIKLIMQKTKAEKEEELCDLKKLIKKAGVNEIVIGGIGSNYQGSRIEKLAREMGVKVYAPLWGYSTEKLWGELINSGFKVILTKIASEGIPLEFIGKVINYEKLNQLKKLSEKYKFRLDFEGGDAESAVLWMPEFKNEIKLVYNIKSDGSFRHFLKIKNVK